MARDQPPGESPTETNVAEFITDSIDNSIDELESLIVETKLPPRPQPEIPVLNDIVDAAEARRYAKAITMAESPGAPVGKIENIPIDRLSKLVDSVDQELSNELDALVGILKDSTKDIVMDELKEQLKKEAAQTQSPPPAIDSPDKPFA